jgi:hypothetical protein
MAMTREREHLIYAERHIAEVQGAYRVGIQR